MECRLCGLNKPLEDFAKTHRRNRDNAKCKTCMDKVLKVQPDEPVKDEGDDDDYDFDSSDSNPYADDDDVTTSINGLSVDGTDRTTTSEPGGVWVPQSRTLGSTTTASQRGGFDMSAYAAASRSAATPASASGYSSARLQPAALAQPPMKTSKGGWAKPPKASSAMEDDIPESSDDDDANWNRHEQEEDSDDSGP
ncbi:MAG: hypothetical protein Q9159_005861 [Coniocarpon cinnabarinum]